MTDTERVRRDHVAKLHYPINDMSCVCVCGWKPPAYEHWRQQMRLNEHLRDIRLGSIAEDAS